MSLFSCPHPLGHSDVGHAPLFIYNCPCWQLSGGKSSRPSLSVLGCILCGKFKIVPVYKMVGVIF